jgi:hypothetical protein
MIDTCGWKDETEKDELDEYCEDLLNDLEQDVS